MRRRDFLLALAATPAALMFPDRAQARGEIEGGVAVATVPLVRAIRRGEQGRLAMHAVPRGDAEIRDVSFSIYKGEPAAPEVLVGPERRLPEERAPGEYHAVVAVPRRYAHVGVYFVHWRITTSDGHVTLADHPFNVTYGLTRLHVTR